MLLPPYGKTKVITNAQSAVFHMYCIRCFASFGQSAFLGLPFPCGLRPQAATHVAPPSKVTPDTLASRMYYTLLHCATRVQRPAVLYLEDRSGSPTMRHLLCAISSICIREMLSGIDLHV